MHAVLNAGRGLCKCISLDGARLYAYMSISICVDISKNIISNGYTIYIYTQMCLYDIWLPAGSLQRKLLTLCITPQRSGLSVMYNP